MGALISTVAVLVIAEAQAHQIAASAPAQHANWRRQQPRPLSFFLHGSGAFDFREEAKAFVAATSGRRETDSDTASWQWTFQYSVDAFLIPALYSHPARSLSPAATSLHVLAIAPSAAGFVHNDRLTTRMEAVADALSSDPHAAAMWSNMSVHLLVFAPAENVRDQLGHRLADKLARRGSLVRLATCDPFFGEVRPNHPYTMLFKSALTVPYVVRPSFSRLARGACGSEGAAHLTAPRSSVVFHGDTGRYDWGTRAAVRDIMRYINESDWRSSYAMRENASAFRAQAALTASAMLHGAFCFVPSGDTATSRRLFEAMVTGCLPIIVRLRDQWTRALPFPSLVDWYAFAYFLTPAAMSIEHRHRPPPPDSTVWSHRQAEAAWVDAQRLAHEPARLARRKALAAFCAHLDPQANPIGVIDALLFMLRSPRERRLRPSANHSTDSALRAF